MNREEERRITDHVADKRYGETYDDARRRQHLDRQEREDATNSVASAENFSSSHIDSQQVRWKDMTWFAKLLTLACIPSILFGGIHWLFQSPIIEIEGYALSGLMLWGGIALLLFIRFTMIIAAIICFALILRLYIIQPADISLIDSIFSFESFKTLLWMCGVSLFTRLFTTRK